MGKGAFMETLDDARKLSDLIMRLAISQHAKRFVCYPI